jgi:gluconolactonase
VLRLTAKVFLTAIVLTASGVLLLAARTLAESTPVVAVPEVHVLAGSIHGPEGPTVMSDGSVLLVEFFSGEVLRIRPDGRRDSVANVGVGVAGTAQSRTGILYVARVNYDLVQPAGASRTPASTSGGQILSIDLDSHRVSRLYTEYEGAALKGPDDLVIDSDDDIWWTDVLEQSVYWGRGDGSEIRRPVSGASGVNGITLSSDGRYIYIVSRGRLVAYHIVGRGRLEMDGAQPRAHVVTPLSMSLKRLDGLKTQANGNVVMADWVEGLLVVSPGGHVLSQTKLPGNLQPVNMAFGGPDKRTLFIAAASGGADGWKLQGKLVAMSWPDPGL